MTKVFVNFPLQSIEMTPHSLKSRTHSEIDDTTEPAGLSFFLYCQFDECGLVSRGEISLNQPMFELRAELQGRMPRGTHYDV